MNSANHSKDNYSRRSFFVLGSLVVAFAFLYCTKLFLRHQYAEKSNFEFLGYQSLRGIIVPAGPFVDLEKTAPPVPYKAVSLGLSCPMSADAKGDMILYIGADDPPEDFKDIKRTGQYLRTVGGKYRNIGNDPSQLTVDGKLVQVHGEMGHRTITVDGREISPDSINAAITWDDRSNLFAASAGKFVNVRFELEGNSIGTFTEDGKHSSFPRMVNCAELLPVTLLRKVGIFETGEQGFSSQSMEANLKGEVYGQSWGDRGIFMASKYTGGRLCRVANEKVELVAELKDVKINTEMFVSPGGKVGINLYENRSFHTRPAYFESGKLTALPIPKGSFSAELMGIADDGTAVIVARNQQVCVVHIAGKLYPFDLIVPKELKGNLYPHMPFQTGIMVDLPNAIGNLRYERPMLADGSILCLTSGKFPRLYLLKK